MNCPACGKGLEPLQSGDVTVDVCYDCGGIWFDQFEFKKFDEVSENADILLGIHKKDGVEVDFEKQRHCPKCNDVVMMEHYSSIKRKVKVNECPMCGGYWLDSGELALVRSEFANEDERREAAVKYALANKDIQAEMLEEKAKNEDGAGKIKKFANIFKYICPSFYVKGKQDWGAF